jgi:hypothetical protein
MCHTGQMGECKILFPSLWPLYHILRCLLYFNVVNIIYGIMVTVISINLDYRDGID